MSPILQTIDVRDIGKKFSLRNLGPFLCSGVVSACFHSSGSRPVEKDLSNIYVHVGASSDAHDLRKHSAIWSGPGDLLGLSL